MAFSGVSHMSGVKEAEACDMGERLGTPLMTSNEEPSTAPACCWTCG